MTFCIRLGSAKEMLKNRVRSKFLLTNEKIGL